MTLSRPPLGPFNMSIWIFHREPETQRCLKLIIFTHKLNLPPVFPISVNYTWLPKVKKWWSFLTPSSSSSSTCNPSAPRHPSIPFTSLYLHYHYRNSKPNIHPLLPLTKVMSDPRICLQPQLSPVASPCSRDLKQNPNLALQDPAIIWPLLTSPAHFLSYSRPQSPKLFNPYVSLHSSLSPLHLANTFSFRSQFKSLFLKKDVPEFSEKINYIHSQPPGAAPLSQLLNLTVECAA